jgi:hypothetical protein
MKTTVLLKKLLGVPVVTRSRTGFVIALVAVITLVGQAALTGVDFLSRNDALVRMVVGLLGFLGWLSGRVREAKRPQPTPIRDEFTGEVVVEHPLAFLVSLKSWGVILVLIAGTLSCLTAWRRHEPARVVRARPQQVTKIAVTNLVTTVVTNVVTLTNSEPKLVFPSLQLQGLVVNGPRSSALINGHVLYVGEALSNAVLVAVDSEHAMLTMEGQTKILSLRK